jgi:hypothetical protein
MDTGSGKQRRHLLIAGPGRSGTTLLVRVLSALGMETHLDVQGDDEYDDVANAGLEDELGRPDAPYVVKSPFAYHSLDHVLSSGEVVLDHAIVPVRNLREVAASRVIAELQWVNSSPDLAAAVARSGATWEHRGSHAGGVTYSLEPLDQERILAAGFARLIETLVKHDVPTILLDFPRFANDPAYLAERLQPLGRDISTDTIAAVLDDVVDDSKIRVGRELDGQLVAHEAGVSDRPTLDELDNVALRRVLLERHAENERLFGEFQQVQRSLAEAQSSAQEAAESASAHIRRLRSQLDSARADVNRLKRLVARKNRRLDAFKNSKTMRYTAPVRNAYRAIRPDR